MKEQEQEITRRSLKLNKLDQLIQVIHELVTNDTAFAKYTASPLAFFQKHEKSQKIQNFFKKDLDFAEISELILKIRKAVQTSSLDINFLFNFAEIKGSAKNYQSYTETKHNFDKSESSERNYAGSDPIRTTKPGWKSYTVKRLDSGVDSGFKRIGDGKFRLSLAGQDFGPLLNPKLSKTLLDETKT